MFGLVAEQPLPCCAAVIIMEKSERSALVVNAATVMLECYGVGAIWELNIAASLLGYRGHNAAAEVTLAIADEAEREWLRRQTRGLASPDGSLTSIANS
ncbi:MAG: hypothetical protein JO001_06910 [Alphaproteobacteria bacterium]|nr:hypothetical protein [Alphaproteobacteria bacterium]